MDEITLDDKTYVSSKRAAKITGYATDYVGQLCREGRVEARLVGRNWYVLESSLREHRFGSENSKQGNSNANTSSEGAKSSWQPSNYISESGTTLPNFEKKELGSQYEAAAASLSESNVVKEMQNAWQDWFTRKNQQIKMDEPELESPGAMLARDLEEGHVEESESEPIALHTLPESQENEYSEPETIHITRVEEPKYDEETQETPWNQTGNVEFEEEEEVVPIHRTYVPPVTVTPPSHRQDFELPRERNMTRNDHSYAPEGRVIRERRVKAKRRGSLVLTTLFVCIAIIAVAVAAIGSGKFDQFIAKSGVHYTPVQFLEGESSINK